MANQFPISSSADGISSTGKFAQKMIQLQRERHMLLTLSLKSGSVETLKRHFTSRTLYEEIIWQIEHVHDEHDPYDFARRYWATLWEDGQDKLLHDVSLLSSVYDDADLALSALLHFSNKALELWKGRPRPPRERKPPREDMATLDNAILALSRQIAKDPKISDYDATETLHDARVTIHKIRMQYDITYDYDDRPNPNPYFLESYAFLMEECHMRVAYMVAKRVVEGQKSHIPEELVEMIARGACQRTVWRFKVMKEEFQPDAKKARVRWWRRPGR